MSLFGRKEKDEIARLKAQMSPEQLQAADSFKNSGGVSPAASKTHYR